MIENIQEVGEDLIETMLPVAPWQHVRLMGEDIVASELLLPEGHLLKPTDLGAMAQAGVTDVAVRRKPKVAVIPTGTELVLPGQSLKPGKIIESNSLVLAGLVEEWGAAATRRSPTPDDYDQLKKAIRDAVAEHDIVVVNAGASAGRRDFTASLVGDLGQVIVHGVAIRPGHPVVLGVVDGKPVVGVPGYPVSAALTLELLVGKVGDNLLATPLPRGAGATMSFVRADGIVRIPRGSEGIQEGQPVRVELLSSLEQIENAIVVIGSHDLALDVLANHLHHQYPERTLSSSNVGSLGGLVALSRGEAHLAGSHLLDEETGEYNVSYVKRILDGKEVVRQRGAGTRVLLDFKARETGLDPTKINGYDRTAFTHLAVAVAVAGGAADAGLGILAAARALDLDFVPLLKERYDLIIPRVHYESRLGGYDVSEMGRVIART